jgi:uracil phosphoribosyltransferase
LQQYHAYRELEAYEISKTLNYEGRDVATPLGISRVNVPSDRVVLATIFRAGLPFHNGFLNIFDHAGNAFVSAYREYKDEEHTKVGIHVEYLATPSIDEKTLVIADPMLATGGSMELGYKAFSPRVRPSAYTWPVSLPVQRASITSRRLSRRQDHPSVRGHRPGMNEHKYIVPGFGDAGDLCYGTRCKEG